MSMIHSDMNALLGSRICHDLISPLGAIGNGVELLQMSGLSDSAELSLITESVENANARIRLFRIAFGAASAEQMVPSTEIAAILKTFGAARGIAIDWAPPAQLARDAVRLAFLMLLCGETVLPWGGRIGVEMADGPIRVVIDGDRVKSDPALWEQLTDAAAPMPGASEIHFPLARHAAEAMRREIGVDCGETRIVMTA